VDSDYCMTMTTIDDEAAAAKLARAIVEQRLAACVQILTVRSVFRWEGAVDDTPELLLLVKTRADRYDELEAFIREHHSYDVPEILQVPVVAGFAPYLAWIDENTRS
jgi:periplasmic divalent cation tolerance protein